MWDDNKDEVRLLLEMQRSELLSIHCYIELSMDTFNNAMKNLFVAKEKSEKEIRRIEKRLECLK